MPPNVSRRSFLRNAVPHAMREAARTRQALADGLEQVRTEAEAPRTSGRPWAGPAGLCCGPAELDRLLADEGLVHRSDDVRALATVSYRLVPEAPARSHPLGTNGLRIGVELRSLPASPWPMPTTALPDVLAIEVAFELGAVAGVVTPLPGTGSRPERPEIGGVALTASPELVLPRAWTAAVEAVGLQPDEQTAWERLRLALAELQGVHPLDSTEQTHRLHRLFGYPDDRTGMLPLICESVDRGAGADVDLAGAALASLEQDAQRWILLLQIAAMDGDAEQTVTIWCDRTRLAQGNLGRLIALRRRP